MDQVTKIVLTLILVAGLTACGGESIGGGIFVTDTGLTAGMANESGPISSISFDLFLDSRYFNIQ